MIPSLPELSYFFEVANTRNITHAAKNLRITQPAVTRAIKNLEKAIGEELFVRHQKGMIITRAGKQLLQQTKYLLQCWQNTMLAARASHRVVEGRATIGCHTTVGIYMHQIVFAILNKYPKLDIEICNALPNTILQQVVDLTVDIGLVSNPIQHPDLIMKKITQTEITFWAGVENNALQDFHSENTVIICNPDFDHTQRIFKKVPKLKTKRLLKVTSVEVIASLTANGCGIGLLPACIVQNLYPGRLKPLPKSPSVVEDLYLIYRKESMAVRAIKTVIDIIKEMTAV